MISFCHGDKRFGLWLILCLVLIGCVGSPHPAKNVTFYTFSYAPPPVAKDSLAAVVLQIDPFTAAPLYDTDKIVYQPESFQRNVYHYHRWRSHPADLVTHYLARDLKASGRFAAVITETGRLSATHLVTGSVDEILEQDTADGWQAIIGITVMLSKTGEPRADRAIVYQKSYRKSQMSSSRSPSAVVAAMSIAMSAVSEAVAADLHAALSNSTTPSDP